MVVPCKIHIISLPNSILTLLTVIIAYDNHVTGMGGMPGGMPGGMGGMEGTKHTQA